MNDRIELYSLNFKKLVELNKKDLEIRNTSVDKRNVIRTYYDLNNFKADTNDPNELVFGNVMWRSAETFKPFDMYLECLREYKVNNISKHFGLSFTEFMKLPYYRYTDLCDAGLMFTIQEAKEYEKNANDLKNKNKDLFNLGV